MSAPYIPGQPYSVGGAKSTKIAYECGLVFSREPLETNGKTYEVVAIWKASDPKSSIYMVTVGNVIRSTENLIGCAVLALEHLGITRPRLGSIQRVAGVIQSMA